MALQLLKNPHDAEDVLQDAYITAFSKINDAIPEKFQGWLDTIVINRAKDVLKKKKPGFFSEAKTEDGKEYLLDEKEEKRTEFLPQENMDYQETKRLIQEIIDELPDEQRMAVMLYYYKEMPVGQIAQYFECSDGTIKSRLNYARNSIKVKVEELEKKGTKLYSIPILPFLYWMFKSEAEEAVCMSANILHGIQQAVGNSSKLAEETLKTSVKSVGKTVSTSGIKGIAAKVGGLSVGMKVGIVAVTAVIGITGGVAIHKSFAPHAIVTETSRVKKDLAVKKIDKTKDNVPTNKEENAKLKETSVEEINKKAKDAYKSIIPTIYSEIAECDKYFANDDINGDGILDCVVFADDYREFSIYGGADEVSTVPYTQMTYIMTYYNGKVVKLVDGSQDPSSKYTFDKEKGYICYDFSSGGMTENNYFKIENGELKKTKGFSYVDNCYSVDGNKVTEDEYKKEKSKYGGTVGDMEPIKFYKVSEKSVESMK